jgi:N6-L-threonylcarbamoyladenine synthase
MMKEVKILAIETSCDETSAAVLFNNTVKSNVINSQIEIHNIYGGVVPEIASRSHLENLPEVVDLALEQAEVTKEDIDVVAVTYGPGLVGALLCGISYAKSFAYGLGKRLIGVNHLAGHISANFLCGARPPFVCLIASGGHTNIVHVRGYTKFEVIGRSIDDAAGEAFDKVARSIGLGYPGGPKLDELAQYGDPTAISFPRVKMTEDNFDFSFSGLKSAVLNYINITQMKGAPIEPEDISASFRQCVSDILTTKTLRAADQLGLNSVCLCGGVSRNILIRSEFHKKCAASGLKLTIPPAELCSDNAAMIGSAAYHLYLKDAFSDFTLNAEPSLAL